MTKYTTYSEAGKRVGESHPRCTISNDRVDEVRELHEDCGWSYARIARKFKIPIPTIAKLCRYERRATSPARWVRNL